MSYATRITDRESSYHARRHDRYIREDGMSYKEAMVNANLERERADLIEEARKELLDESTGLRSGWMMLCSH